MRNVEATFNQQMVDIERSFISQMKEQQDGISAIREQLRELVQSQQPPQGNPNVGRNTGQDNNIQAQLQELQRTVGNLSMRGNHTLNNPNETMNCTITGYGTNCTLTLSSDEQTARNNAKLAVGVRFTEYDGNTSYSDWRTSFLAKLNFLKPTEMSACLHALSLMSGKAASMTKHLREEQPPIQRLSDLFSRLDKIFHTVGDAAIAANLYETCTQQEDQSIQDYFIRLDTLFRQAYPESPPESSRQLANKFARGLLSQTIRQQILQPPLCENIAKMAEKAMQLATVYYPEAQIPGNKSRNTRYKMATYQEDRHKDKVSVMNDDSIEVVRRKEEPEVWCNYHKVDTHDTSECRAQQKDPTGKNARKTLTSKQKSYIKAGRKYRKLQQNAKVKRRLSAIEEDAGIVDSSEIESSDETEDEGVEDPTEIAHLEGAILMMESKEISRAMQEITTDAAKRAKLQDAIMEQATQKLKSVAVVPTHSTLDTGKQQLKSVVVVPMHSDLAKDQVKSEASADMDDTPSHSAQSANYAALSGTMDPNLNEVSDSLEMECNDMDSLFSEDVELPKDSPSEDVELSGASVHMSDADILKLVPQMHLESEEEYVSDIDPNTGDLVLTKDYPDVIFSILNKYNPDCSDHDKQVFASTLIKMQPEIWDPKLIQQDLDGFYKTWHQENKSLKRWRKAQNWILSRENFKLTRADLVLNHYYKVDQKPGRDHKKALDERRHARNRLFHSTASVVKLQDQIKDLFSKAYDVLAHVHEFQEPGYTRYVGEEVIIASIRAIEHLFVSTRCRTCKAPATTQRDRLANLDRFRQLLPLLGNLTPDFQKVAEDNKAISCLSALVPMTSTADPADPYSLGLTNSERESFRLLRDSEKKLLNEVMAALVNNVSLTPRRERGNLSNCEESVHIDTLTPEERDFLIFRRRGYLRPVYQKLLRKFSLRDTNMMRKYAL